MIKVTMTIKEERGQEEWYAFLDPCQKKEAETYKKDNPDANVIMFHLDSDGTYIYGPVIE